MNQILHKFKITYNPSQGQVMYSHLIGDRYGKTWMKDSIIRSQIITLQEYASALAHIILKPNPPLRT